MVLDRANARHGFLRHPFGGQDGSMTPSSEAQTERALLRGALARSGGNVSQATRLLGITRITMQRRLERLRSLENKEQDVCS